MKNQNKLYIVIIICAMLAILLGVGFIYGKNAYNPFNKLSNTIGKSIEKQKIDFEILELAQTPLERQIGYMNRESICAKCGMLFIFEKTQPLSFWMKNTLVPLNIIFIDENGVVINIGVGQPNVTNPPVISNKPGLYVLEVPTSSPLKLNSGDVVDIDHLKSIGKTHTTTVTK